MTEKPRILIVDDNEKAARTLAMLCELSNTSVKYVTTGKMAIRQASDFKPDLILLDIGMPDIDGYDVCRQIRKENKMHDVKIYANSGWTDDEHKEKSIQAGFDGYLVKPVPIKVLYDIIAEL
jgi:DNA-binding response OmpR family regulator